MKRWQDRVLAGSDAHSLLFPDAANVAVKINRKPSEQTKELKEKKKLLEALSEVKPE